MEGFVSASSGNVTPLVSPDQQRADEQARAGRYRYRHERVLHDEVLHRLCFMAHLGFQPARSSRRYR